MLDVAEHPSVVIELLVEVPCEEILGGLLRTVETGDCPENLVRIPFGDLFHSPLLMQYGSAKFGWAV
ncbi:hypothetical protein ACFLU6_12125 [Acidobacteriota bacterium]